MAMIENIRKRRGLLIFFIGLGMLGFLVPYDAVMSMFGRTPGSETVGEINGKVITRAVMQEQLVSVQQSNLYRGDDNVENAVWIDLTNDGIYGADIEAAGYRVGEEEYDDLRFGVSPSSMVKTAYYGGIVTEESRESARNLFETQQPIAERAQKAMIVKRYKLEKLEALLKKGIYANTLDAERDHLLKGDKSKVDMVAIKYEAISDSTVTISDSQAMSYFNKNKLNPKYKQNPFREVQLISYDVLASSQDTVEIKDKLSELVSDFKTTKDDSLFVIDESKDRIYLTEDYEPGSTAGDTDSLLMTAPVGAVVGPYQDGGAFKISKIIDKKPIVDRVEGRHIFLASGFQRAEKDSVLALADSIKGLLEGGAGFSGLAAKWSTDDTTSTKGGSLGWLSIDDEIIQDQKVKNTLRTRLIDAEKNKVSIAEVPGGVSIYEATNFEYDGKKSVLAVISKTIEPSEATKDEIYEGVSSFALSFSSGEDLLVAAEEEGLTVTSQKVRSASKTIPSIPNSGEIVRWARSVDTDLDDVSSIFTIGDKFIVATLSNIQDDKVPSFTSVEDAVRKDALNQAKYEYIAQIIKAAPADMTEIAEAVEGTDQKSATCTFNSNNLNGLGSNEPEAVGLAFGAPEGTITRPVKGNAGVVVMQVSEITLGAEKASYSDDQATLQGSYEGKYGRIRSSLVNKLVKDERNR